MSSWQNTFAWELHQHWYMSASLEAVLVYECAKLAKKSIARFDVRDSEAVAHKVNGNAGRSYIQCFLYQVQCVSADFGYLELELGAIEPLGMRLREIAL